MGAERTRINRRRTPIQEEAEIQEVDAAIKTRPHNPNDLILQPGKDAL